MTVPLRKNNNSEEEKMTQKTRGPANPNASKRKRNRFPGWDKPSAEMSAVCLREMKANPAITSKALVMALRAEGLSVASMKLVRAKKEAAESLGLVKVGKAWAWPSAVTPPMPEAVTLPAPAAVPAPSDLDGLTAALKALRDAAEEEMNIAKTMFHDAQKRAARLHAAYKALTGE